MPPSGFRLDYIQTILLDLRRHDHQFIADQTWHLCWRDFGERGTKSRLRQGDSHRHTHAGSLSTGDL